MKRRPIYVLLALMLFLSLVGSACKKSEPKPTETPTLVPTVTTVPPTVTPIPVTPTPLPDYTPPPAGSIPPYVLQRSPERGEELGIEQPIELIFDRPMDRSSVERAMVVSVDGGATLDGDFDWTTDRAVRFRPRGLARDTRYHLYLGQDAKSHDGALLDGAYRFKFSDES